MHAPDWWDWPRFQAVSLAQSWFRQNGFVSSHPPAGNAHRSAARKTVNGWKEQLFR